MLKREFGKTRRTSYYYFISCCILFICIIIFTISFLYSFLLKTQKDPKPPITEEKTVFSQFQDNIEFTEILDQTPFLPSDSPLRSFKENTRNLFKTRKLRDKIYSKFYKHTNIPTRGQDWKTSSYLLENVCLNRRGELLLYSPEEELEVFQSEIGNFEYIAVLHSQIHSVPKRGGIKAKIINGALPDNQRWLLQDAVLMKRYANGNVGHILTCNLAPVFELMLSFGLNPKEIVPIVLDEIFNRDCSKIFPVLNECEDAVSSFKYDKNSTAYYSMSWFQLTFPQPLLQRCSYEVQITNNNKQSTKSLFFNTEVGPCPRDDIWNELRKKSGISSTPQFDYNGNLDEEIDVCFKKVILGIGNRAMIGNSDVHGRSKSFFALRNQILENNGLIHEDIHSKKEILIGIHNKPSSGRHGNAIHNRESIIKYLTYNLPTSSIVNRISKPVTIVDIKLEELGYKEQLQLFSKLDVYISTIGSGSLMSLFMPDNSALLYTPECRIPLEQASLRKIAAITKSKLDKGIPVDKYTSFFVCKQPIVYVHESFMHLNVYDLTSSTRDCLFRMNSNAFGTFDRCDPILSEEAILKLVLAVLEMKHLGS
ncbi:hypothetical protein ABK040_001232 [Willaertia magna]